MELFLRIRMYAHLKDCSLVSCFGNSAAQTRPGCTASELARPALPGNPQTGLGVFGPLMMPVREYGAISNVVLPCRDEQRTSEVGHLFGTRQAEACGVRWLLAGSWRHDE